MEKLTVLLRIFLLFIVATFLSATVAHAGSASRVVSVPAIGVQGEGLPGVVNYILIQFDQTAAQDGPTVQFNEINLGGGSRVSEDWKEGVKQAVAAATKAVGEDGREWVITIKNRSYSALTEGMSASSAVVVGIVAAWRGDDVKSDGTSKSLKWQRWRRPISS